MNGIEYHLVEIKFIVDRDEYEDYAVPVSLPEDEGSAIIEDSNIYMEIL